MKPLADAVNGAEKLVFYAHCFSCAETGPADIPLDALDPQKPLVTGVADKPGKPDSKAVMVQLPSGRPVPFGPAALERNLPDVQDGVERRGWHSYAPQIRRLRLQSPRSTKAGGIYRMVEHGCTWRARKRDNLIEIHNPNVVVAYAMQTVSIFAHYGFRNRMKRAEQNQRRETSVSLPRKRGPLVEAELPVRRHQMPRPEAVCGLACCS